MANHSIEEWFQLYEKDITSFLIYYTGSLDVEDLVQETFLVAIKKMPLFKGNSHPKTWLISIARNHVIDQYRRAKIWKRLRHLVYQEQMLLNELEEGIIASQETIELHRAICLLNPRYKEIVILRGILELPSKEVSEIVKSNVNQVNVMFHRSLKRLKEILVEEGYADDGDGKITRNSERPT